MKILKNRKVKIGLLIFGIIIFLFAGLVAYKIKTCGCKKKGFSTTKVSLEMGKAAERGRLKMEKLL